MHDAVRILGEARRVNTGVSLSDELVPADEDDAYALQRAVQRWQDEKGQGHVVGYKIGCTTAVMQEIVGVPNPVFGGVLEPNVHKGEASFPIKKFQKVGIECEIAVRLSSSLPATGAPYDRSAVEAAIGGCMAAIEIVDDRYGDFLSVPAPVLIADDFFHSACISPYRLFMPTGFNGPSCGNSAQPLVVPRRMVQISKSTGLL